MEMILAENAFHRYSFVFLISIEEKVVNIIKSKEVVFVISRDSVGETAEFVVKAVATQFNGGNINIHRHAFAEDTVDIEEVINRAKDSNSIIAYTLAIPELKEYLDQRANEEGIMAVDIMRTPY